MVLVVPGCERFLSAPTRRTAVRAAVRHFANGELWTEAPEGTAGRSCVIVGSISPPAGNLERLTLVAHALRRAGAARITAVLPYLAYARQDRAAGGMSLGLAWVGELLQASGVREVICVDVHSPEASRALGLPVRSLAPADLLGEALAPEWRSGVTFIAPDEGAIERCAAVARAAGSDQPIVWARKRRTSTGVEHLALSSAPGPQALVVDDILDTGDTLLSCCRALRDAGVTRFGVVVTHGLFTGDRWRALLAEGVEEILITDTVLSRRRPRQAGVIPVAPLLAPVLEEMPAVRCS